MPHTPLRKLQHGMALQIAVQFKKYLAAVAEAAAVTQLVIVRTSDVRATAGDLTRIYTQLQAHIDGCK